MLITRKDFNEMVDNWNSCCDLWDLLDLFEERYPKLFKKALNSVCKQYGIRPSTYEGRNEFGAARWEEMCWDGEADDFRLDLKWTLLEVAECEKEFLKETGV